MPNEEVYKENTGYITEEAVLFRRCDKVVASAQFIKESQDIVKWLDWGCALSLRFEVEDIFIDGIHGGYFVWSGILGLGDLSKCVCFPECIEGIRR